LCANRLPFFVVVDDMSVSASEKDSSDAVRKKWQMKDAV
jgi:hypothetical protein